MKVRVKYFALYRDLLGKADEEFQLDKNATIEDLLNRLMSLHPHLKDARAYMLISLNGEFVDKGARLKDGDVIAFFPPVSGG